MVEEVLLLFMAPMIHFGLTEKSIQKESDQFMVVEIDEKELTR